MQPRPPPSLLPPALHSRRSLLFTQQTFNMLFVSQCSAGYWAHSGPVKRITLHSSRPLPLLLPQPPSEGELLGSGLWLPSSEVEAAGFNQAGRSCGTAQHDRRRPLDMEIILTGCKNKRSPRQPRMAAVKNLMYSLVGLPKAAVHSWPTNARAALTKAVKQ